MKEPVTVYVPVKSDTELPKENNWHYVVENGYKETLYFDTDDNMFLSDGNKAKVSSWLKPQELITFTKEEWDKQEQEAELRQKKYDSLFEEYKSLNTRRNEEIERLKGLIEVAHKDSHILFVPDKFKEELWQQFKTENNL